MALRQDLSARSVELRASRIPFVHARVVLAERPTAAKPGDEGIILADGTMEGFVGGDCAEITVRQQSLEALKAREPVLLRITPTPEPNQPGKIVVHNPCLSGGTLEIFLEPLVPPPLVHVLGTAPTAGALLSLGRHLGYAMSPYKGRVGVDAAALVVASHGQDESEALVAALQAGVPYVGLVASRNRGRAVVDNLPVSADLKAKVHTPAGLDIGATTAEEVAISILAEIVASRPRTARSPKAGAAVLPRHRDRPGVRDVGAGQRRRRPHRRRRARWPYGLVLRAGVPEGVPGRPRRLPAHRHTLTDLAQRIPSPAAMQGALAKVGYLADDGIATALFCAARLPQPLLLEGEAGVGKTEAAKVLAEVLDTPLIRLQCYEGIDAAEALYEWNFPRQLLAIRLAEAAKRDLEDGDLFGREYLIGRPLLRAVDHPGPRPAVLLIDEIDRADDEFEAFLFELLAEGSVTIPELGTIHATHPPIVVLTSNRTRDLHDALKRRCLYHWIDYPDLERTTAIIRRRVPAASQTLAAQVAAAVRRLRTLDMQKPPGVAEAINWVLALDLLGLPTLDVPAVAATLGSVIKYREDLEVVSERGLAWVAAQL